MKFGMLPAPFQRSRRSTTKIMAAFTAGLVVLWIASIVYNFTLRTSYGTAALTIGLVAIGVTIVLDFIVAAIKIKGFRTSPLKEWIRKIIKDILHSYSYVTALVFALTLPVGTPTFVVVIGAVIATLIGKIIFGGFGYNIFNPAAIGRIIVGITYPTMLVHYLRESQIGTIVSGATPTSGISSNWFTTTLPEGINGIGQLFLGNYSGAIGETFTALILVIGILYIALDVIDWRIPVFYLGTLSLCAIGVALFKNINAVEYMMIHLSIGGAAFGAVFMLTDPVTSPTSPYGKILYAVLAALLTFLIRVNIGPEGVIYSIALVNIATPVIDRFIKGKTGERIRLKAIVTIVAVLLSVGLNVGFIALKDAQAQQSGTSALEIDSAHTLSVTQIGNGGNSYE